MTAGSLANLRDQPLWLSTTTGRPRERLVVCGRQRASERRADAEHLKEIAR